MKNSKISILCSTLDEECGLSEYTLSLKEGLEKNSAKILLLKDITKFQAIEEFKPDVVNLQFEYGLYTASDLNHFFNKLRRAGIKSVVTTHGLNDWDPIKNNLFEHKADEVIVHTERGRRRLIEMGVPSDKIYVIPHGIKKFELRGRKETRKKLGIQEDTKIVAIHGFFEPYKNYDKVAEAIGILQRAYPDIVILQSCHSKGHSEAKSAKKRYERIIKRDKINVIKFGRGRFISPEEIVQALHASDCTVYPYIEAFSYSGSGAIRMAISANVPVVCSDITFFEDIPNECVLKLRTNNPRDIAVGISEIFEKKKLRDIIVENQRKLVDKWSWDNIGKLYIDRLQNK